MGVGHSFSASDLTLLENVAHADTRALISAHPKTKHLSIGSNASNSSAISHGTAQGSRMRADISRVFRPFSEEYVLDMDDVLGTGGCAAKISSGHAMHAAAKEGRSAACRIGVTLLITHSTHRYAVVRRATHRETHKDFAVKIMSIGKAAEAEPPAEEEAVDGEGGAEDEQQFLTYEQVINEIDLVQVCHSCGGHTPQYC